MIPKKVRNNASISYFFLGWLFLLAKNPNFSDPFVRHHAKYATKGHALFFLVYFVYGQFLSPFFSYSIPVINITVSHVIEVGLFAALTLFIISGVYASQKTDTADTAETKEFFEQKGRTFEFQGATEAQRMMLLLSYIPFLGMVIARNHPNIVTRSWARTSSLFALAYIVVFSSLGSGSLSNILLFLGILMLVYLASRFFLSDRYSIYPWIEKIPSTETVYLYMRTIPGYWVDIFRTILGKHTALDLRSRIEKVRLQDANLRESLESYFTVDSLPFQPLWIFIPGINLICIPTLFTQPASKYVIAIGQGLVITLLAIIIGLTYGFTSSLELFLLFPIFYWIAADPFVRIPLIYEIYSIINTLTFGLLKNKKRLDEVKKQDQEVSFKI